MRKYILILTVILAFIGWNAAAYADSSAGASAGASADNILTFTSPAETTVNSNIRGARSLPMQSEFHYPTIIPYIGPNTPSRTFRPIERILLYTNEFKVKEMEKVLGLVVTDTEATVKVYINGEKVKDAILRGYIGEIAQKNETSIDVLFRLCLAARRLGANAVHVTGQGVERELSSKGGGIGFAGTKASLTANEDGGSAAGFGTGYAWGKSKRIDTPWINAIAISVPE